MMRTFSFRRADILGATPIGLDNLLSVYPPFREPDEVSKQIISKPIFLLQYINVVLKHTSQSKSLSKEAMAYNLKYLTMYNTVTIHYCLLTASKGTGKDYGNQHIKRFYLQMGQSLPKSDQTGRTIRKQQDRRRAIIFQCGHGDR